jgi:ketosteroid isomerase-like protein
LGAPGFVYTEDATVMNKEELIRSIMAERATLAHNEEMKVHAYGDTAVVTGILRVRGSGKDGAFDRRYRFTDT